VIRLTREKLGSAATETGKERYPSGERARWWMMEPHGYVQERAWFICQGWILEGELNRRGFCELQPGDDNRGTVCGETVSSESVYPQILIKICLRQRSQSRIQQNNMADSEYTSDAFGVLKPNDSRCACAASCQGMLTPRGPFAVNV